MQNDALVHRQGLEGYTCTDNKIILSAYLLCISVCVWQISQVVRYIEVHNAFLGPYSRTSYDIS